MNDRHSGLNGAGPLHHPIGLDWDSHGSAGDGSEGIYVARSVGRKSGAGRVGELFNYFVDGVVAPTI
jgi:hypothetical protein